MIDGALTPNTPLWRKFKGSLLKALYESRDDIGKTNVVEITPWRQIGTWNPDHRDLMAWEICRMVFKRDDRHWEAILMRYCETTPGEWLYDWSRSPDGEDHEVECREVYEVRTNTIQYRAWKEL